MDAPLLTADFKEFLRLLNAHRVEYLLVGGYAVGSHGFPRATIDLDVWVRATRENSIVRFGVPPLRIEIMTTIDGVMFDACQANRVMFDVDDISVPAISLADRKTNKRAAGRHKDLNDLENLP